jgi:hypothetical protein
MRASYLRPRSDANSESTHRSRCPTHPSSADRGAIVSPKAPKTEGATQTFALLPGVQGDAKFDIERKYRYWLDRRWNAALPQFTYVLLNPSVATASRDDRTTRRLCSLTQAKDGPDTSWSTCSPSLTPISNTCISPMPFVSHLNSPTTGWSELSNARTNSSWAGATGTLRSNQSERANVPFTDGDAKSGRWSDFPTRGTFVATFGVFRA